MKIYTEELEKSFAFRFILLIFTIAFIIWFGGNMIRNAIAYDIILPAEKFIVADLPPDVLFYNVYLFSSLSIYTTIGYSLAFLALIILLINIRQTLKIRGWLTMSVILFFIFSPVEFLKIYYDIMLSKSIFMDSVNTFFKPEIKEYFVDRYSSVFINSVTTLSFFAHLTSIVLLVLKPLDLRKKRIKEDERKTDV